MTYWHGGPRLGEWVLPPDVTGVSRSGDHGVHVTTERGIAEAYASTLTNGWVYEVEPEGALEPVLPLVSGPVISYRCDAARIIRRFKVPRERRQAYRDAILPMLS